MTLTYVRFASEDVSSYRDSDRRIDKAFIPNQLLDADYHTISVSFHPKIIKYALDNCAVNYAGSSKNGRHYYTSDKCEKLGL
jgi:hypothetical protein